MCAAFSCHPAFHLFVLTFGCLCCCVLAAKSMLERLGIDQTNDQENSAGQQLLAQPLALPPCATAAALPLEGNIRPDVLLPGVVQPRLIAGATYSAPHA